MVQKQVFVIVGDSSREKINRLFFVGDLGPCFLTPKKQLPEIYDLWISEGRFLTQAKCSTVNPRHSMGPVYLPTLINFCMVNVGKFAIL